MIIVGFMMKSQASIRCCREQKNSRAPPGLRVEQIARQFTGFGLLFKEMLEALKFIEDD